MGKIYLPNPVDTDGNDIPLSEKQLGMDVPTDNEAELERLQTIMDGFHLEYMRESQKQALARNSHIDKTAEAQINEVAAQHNSLVSSYQEYKPEILLEIAKTYASFSNTEGQTFAQAYREYQIYVEEELSNYSFEAQRNQIELEEMNLDTQEHDSPTLGDQMSLER